ncbi:DEAD/DEAH box helicase [Terrabacter sp. NPDC080008]|uniref:DEAD/DEAH box helicase n=1 Tax=Terrabacter sp. NPDC080008 TaxID=3155176 RepID=UPI00344BFA70
MNGEPTPMRTVPEDLLRTLVGDRPERLVHVHEVPARAAVHADWPGWVDPTLLGALLASGIEAPWSHQVEVAEAAHAGRHVVVSTGTASGKSLGYHLPILTDLAAGAGAPNGRGATALYLSPTKALAADQLSRIDRLALPSVRPATYDGDTPTDERRWIRDHANLVLTNPDLLHHSLLPGHERWSSFLRALRYVVVDECHVYKGVFGAHMAAVLRRLRRVAARYRSEPTFVFASATVAEPEEHASRLLGMPVTPVTQDGSPRASMTFALWEPPLLVDETGQPQRVSTITETGELLAGCVREQVQTVAFARSRAGVEVVARIAKERVPVTDEGRVAAYRGGYLPEERRELEQSLRAKEVLGLAATNALELGVDVSGLDAVLLAGWPGTLSSLWQQAGRAGRSGSRSLAVLVAADDPLDTFVVHHPEAIFGRGIEATVVDPENPHVLAPHLAAAAAELPVTEADVAIFGAQTRVLLDALVARGILKKRPRGWFWGREDRPADHLSLRGAGEPVRIIETRTGRVVGTVDDAAAHSQVHTGAVHLHQGQTWVVTELDLDDHAAFAVRGDPGWTTQAQSVSDFQIVHEVEHEDWGPLRCSFGHVTVRNQVTSFLRRLPGGEVLGEHPLDLPPRSLATKAVWWTMPVEELAAAGVAEDGIPGAAHAAEHAAIGMLPLFATADRWDIGGVSTALHPDTGLPTILIYDGHPGGAGFAERGYRRVRAWLGATRDAIASCECATGCPSCIQSPKCGNGNEPLDKAGAVALLDLVLRCAGAAPAAPAAKATPA